MRALTSWRRERNRTVEGQAELVQHLAVGEGRVVAALVWGPNGQITTAPLTLSDVRTVVDALAWSWPRERRPAQVRRLLVEFGHVEESGDMPDVEREMAERGIHSVLIGEPEPPRFVEMAPASTGTVVVGERARW